MNQELNALLITLVLVIMLVIGGFNIDTLTGTNKEMAKAGLEQCPRYDNGGLPIWVKDCIKYQQSLKEIK